MKKIINIVLSICVLLPLTAAADSPWQAVAAIRAAAVATVPDAGQHGVTVEASVDDGLRLPVCPVTLMATADIPGRATVACAALGWRLYVPLKVRRVLPVVVLARPVAQGQALMADDLRVEPREQASLSQAGFATVEAVQGLQARRSLTAGNVLSSRDVMTPRLIKRGDPVILVLQRDGIEVRMSGRALEDGGLTEQIRVENIGSRRILQGEVRASGEVVLR